MYATRIPDFRRRLIERIVREDPWIVHGMAWGREAKLAKKIGIQPDILEQAAHLLRRGARSEDGNLSLTRLGSLRLRLMLTPEENALLKVYADGRNLLKGTVIRILMHAAMLTSREPRALPRRPARKPGEPPPEVLRRRSCELAPQVTRGLFQAIVQRAGVYGVGYQPYVRYWIVDLIEGKLTDLDIPVVPFLGLFDDAKSYVLPALDKSAKTG